MTGNKEKGPYARIPVSNGVEITMWVNEREGRNGKYKQLNVTITKSWKDRKTGEWKHQSVSTGLNDLYRFYGTISEVKAVEDKFKTERKNIKSENE